MHGKPLILIVDDVDFFLEVEKGYLESTSAQILVARNGQQALEMIAAQQPDLVYLDVNMPVMNGVECCRRVKQDPKLRHVPIIIVYATSKEVDDQEIAASGCDGILHKPIDRDAFLALGRKFLPEVDRRLQRSACQIPVDVSFDGKAFQAKAININPTGMYLHSTESPQPGKRLRISFDLPDREPDLIECWAEVAWLNNGFPRHNLEMPQGFGVAFKLITKQHQGRIEQHLGSKARQ